MFWKSEMERYYQELLTKGVEKDIAIQVTLDAFESPQEFMIGVF